MRRSAKGDNENTGRNVKAKSNLNGGDLSSWV